MNPLIRGEPKGVIKGDVIMKIWNVSVYSNATALQPFDRYSLMEKTEESAYLRASGQHMSSRLEINGGRDMSVHTDNRQHAIKQVKALAAGHYKRDFYL